MNTRLRAVIKQVANVRITRFVAAGVVNTFATYVIYLALLQLPSVHYAMAYTAAYIAGIYFSFWLNARFVFRSAVTTQRLVAYPLTYAVQYLVGVGVLALCVDVLGVPRAWGPLLVVAVTLPLTYLLSRAIMTSTALGRRDT